MGGAKPNTYVSLVKDRFIRSNQINKAGRRKRDERNLQRREDVAVFFLEVQNVWPGGLIAFYTYSWSVLQKMKDEGYVIVRPNSEDEGIPLLRNADDTDRRYIDPLVMKYFSSERYTVDSGELKTHSRIVVFNPKGLYTNLEKIVAQLQHPLQPTP